MSKLSAMVRTAHDRGIDVTAAIWDHIYRGGVQGGGIAGASEQAGKPVPGLVTGVTAENLAPYTKAAPAALHGSLPRNRWPRIPDARRIGPKARGDGAFWHDVFGLLRQRSPISSHAARQRRARSGHR